MSKILDRICMQHANTVLIYHNESLDYLHALARTMDSQSTQVTALNGTTPVNEDQSHLNAIGNVTGRGG